MRKTFLLLAMLAAAVPAAAQTAAPAPAAPAARSVLPTVTLPEMPKLSAGHAAALGAGMFVGALAGSAMIHGGALATVIGAAAGLTVGHWYWSERHEDAD